MLDIEKSTNRELPTFCYSCPFFKTFVDKMIMCPIRFSCQVTEYL